MPGVRMLTPSVPSNGPSLSQRVEHCVDEVNALFNCDDANLRQEKTVAVSVEIAKLVDAVQQKDQNLADQLMEVQDHLDTDKAPDYRKLALDLEAVAEKLRRFDPPEPGKAKGASLKGPEGEGKADTDESDLEAGLVEDDEEADESSSKSVVVPRSVPKIGTMRAAPATPSGLPAEPADPAAATAPRGPTPEELKAAVKPSDPSKQDEPPAITTRRLPGHPLVWIGALIVLLIPFALIGVIMMIMKQEQTPPNNASEVAVPADKQGSENAAAASTSTVVASNVLTCESTETSTVVYVDHEPQAYLAAGDNVWLLEGVVPAESGQCIFAKGERAGQIVPEVCLRDQGERPDCPPRRKL